MKKKELTSLIFTLFLVFAIFLNLGLVKKIQTYLTEALGEPARIMVDVSVNQGSLTPIWQALAQGGEDKEPFRNIIPEITDLKPRYIRIDHIYDFYDVLEKENGQLRFNWTKLDLVVSDILKTGAKPFFSLSYMPPAISAGTLTDQPANWEDWQLLVQKTIEHYSGKNEKNIDSVYYEVWNEPDLFGNWTIGGQKDYLKLYTYAEKGATEAKNINSFKIGGPGSTAPYKGWIDKFLDNLRENQIRIDFYSWHRYSENPNNFLTDINQVDNWMFGKSMTLEKIITEWGSDSENSPRHDSEFDAAHLVAVVRVLLQRTDLIFTFEIKDGPAPNGQKYWGRWGLLTHEASGEVEKKPKYLALQMLNLMGGNRIKLTGEGTWVTGFATREGKKIKIILTNFDKEGRHTEAVPLTLNNLENGDYSYQEFFLTGKGQKTTENISSGVFKKEIVLTPNNIVVLELEKIQG